MAAASFRVVTRPRAVAGAAVLVACAQYLLAEAVAAGAWRNPAYSYATNYISDLGVMDCGRAAGSPLCSPLAAVMNAGFIVAGTLAIGAALLLAPLLRGRAWRWTVASLAAVHGLGSIVVGLVHSAPGTLAGTPRLHVVGAYLAILGGNFALLALGGALLRDRRPAWLAGLCLALGCIGLAAGATLVGSHTIPPGLLERMAVDPITVGEVVTGITLLVGLLRTATARSGSTLLTG